MRTKNATEILDDATLVAWSSFDNGSLTDSGPLRLQVTAVNLTSTNGRINEGIQFISNSSYYQVNDMKLFLFHLKMICLVIWICRTWNIK